MPAPPATDGEASSSDGVPTEVYDQAAAIFKALAHPGRLRIVTELMHGDRCVHELVDALGVAQPTVSQHLGVLRAARLVAATRVGKENRYTLSDHHISHIVGDAVAHANERTP